MIKYIFIRFKYLIIIVETLACIYHWQLICKITCWNNVQGNTRDEAINWYHSFSIWPVSYIRLFVMYGVIQLHVIFTLCTVHRFTQTMLEISYTKYFLCPLLYKTDIILHIKYCMHCCFRGPELLYLVQVIME